MWGVTLDEWPENEHRIFMGTWVGVGSVEGVG